MQTPLPLKLGSITAVYLFWLVCWLVLDELAFGPDHYNWDQSLIAAVAAAAGFRVACKLAAPYRNFLMLLAAGMVSLSMSWLCYDPDHHHAFFHFQEPGAPAYSDISYSLFVFCWVCAWGYFAIEQWRRQPPSVFIKLVFAILFAGLALILANFYYPLYGNNLDTLDGRLDAAASCLEFIVLIMGLVCILLGESVILTWMLLATALLLASDMAYSEQDVPSGIEAAWMFGQMLLWAAMLATPDTLAAIHCDRRKNSPFANDVVRKRTDLSGILMLLSLGGVLLSVGFSLFSLHPVWKAFSAVLFIVGFVALQIWLTNHYEDALRFLKTYTLKIHSNRLQLNDWRSANQYIQATLRSTGLDAYLDWLRQTMAQLKQDVIFLGPERLYPTHKQQDVNDMPRCFIVMPFSFPWSDAVHHTLSDTCKTLAIQPMRGDDVFTPTDILVDIWQGINSADFIIADITGRNPNVLYELGIAHTLAKPVLIISQSASDIPIDLSTRRVIIYHYDENEHWQNVLHSKVMKALQEIIDLYSLIKQ
jgi:hypothetical protein